MLKNSHNISAKIFGLKAEMKHRAIRCDSKRSPHFNDIGVFDNSNAHPESYAYFDGFGDSYANNTRLGEKVIFTGSKSFQVTEIEVFEITD
jgi:hypothetical protein